jgi:sulfate/thiosulfate transport system permease protein
VAGRGRVALRVAALAYLGLLLALPVLLIFWRTFGQGLGPVWAAVTRFEAVHALWLTMFVALIAVPVNTVFGVLCAIVLTRHRFWGRSLVNALIDLPFAVSPVVVGLALVFVYGSGSPVGGWLAARGVQVVFSIPGIVVATVFACLPFVVREVAPVLQEVGTEQEQAAATLGASSWQTFWRVTLPSIRSGVGYGVVLTTARAVGEFGAVSVVSGRLLGQTQTLTMYVEERFQDFDPVGAYAAAVVLALLAVVTLLAMNLLGRRRNA